MNNPPNVWIDDDEFLDDVDVEIEEEEPWDEDYELDDEEMDNDGRFDDIDLT